jgi:dihydroorotate dehydrogenase
MSDTTKYAKKGQVVVGSFQGTTNSAGNVKEYIKDFAKTANLVKETGVKIMEVNLSCPNEGTAHLLCFDTQRAKEVVFAVKEKIGNTPLIIKIAYFQDQNQLETFIKEVGKFAEGISAINTIPAKILDEKGNQALPGGESRLRAGVCGYPIKWAGLDMVKRLKKLRDNLGLSYAIIGVGGVTVPNDFFEYRKNGADIVMSATGAMWNPMLAQDIKKGLHK